MTQWSNVTDSAAIPQGDSLVSRAGNQRIGKWQKLDAVDRVCMSTQRIATSKTKNRKTTLRIVIIRN